MALDVAKGMAYLHNLRFCHRDLKAISPRSPPDVPRSRPDLAPISPPSHPHLLPIYPRSPRTNLAPISSLLRAVKAANVLLSPDHAHAKIGDFGLTSHLGAYSTLTSNAGTPLWSAPEVQIGARAYDERCDIYSYAILILEIFDFRYVHGELLQKEVVRRLVSGWRPDTLALRHVRLLWLVHACWAADPASRPPFERIVKLLDGSAEARAGSMEDLVDAH